ncbi:ImmA/IrrE family metallo-endopeptidase [Ulvibacterium marinum]|uniref:ImmA/IrrE family metallo-endopeptidase n=1 Tax=Ulvibacterium marinum TaxID=2419782 RepID=UPI00249556F3|nr:ImmA/IrrE family metallo-endopeptidase [Ulvibacterium marinum]
MSIIEQKASKLLDSLGIRYTPIPIKKIVKELSIKLNAYDLGNEVSGALVIENDNARIGYNPSESEVRQRFTIAHELGHYILHKGEKKDGLFVDNVKVMFRRQNSTVRELKQEREANAFAASILMPIDLIEKEFDNLYEEGDFLTDDKMVKSLASTFKVSAIAMTYRLINLGYIPGR